MEAVKRVRVRIRWFLKDNGAGEQCNGGDVRQACGKSSLEAIGQLRTSISRVCWWWYREIVGEMVEEKGETAKLGDDWQSGSVTQLERVELDRR